LSQVLSALLSQDERGARMRQASPFCGIMKMDAITTNRPDMLKNLLK
jgi:hypothetical protein